MSSEPFDLPPFDDPMYRKHLEEFDLSEEDTIELLRTLDWCTRTCVDLGFGSTSVGSEMTSSICRARISRPKCVKLASFQTYSSFIFRPPFSAHLSDSRPCRVLP